MTMLCRLLAAILATILFAGSASAQGKWSSLQGGSSITGGSCTSGQFANAINSSGVPTCATPSGSGATESYLSGNKYYLEGWAGYTTTAVTANSNAKCIPGRARAGGTVTAMDFRIVATSAGGKFAMALYSNGTDNKPGSLLYGFIAYGTDAAGVQTQVVSPAVSIVQNAKYWECSTADNATATFSGATGAGRIWEIIGSTQSANIPTSSNTLTGFYSTAYAYGNISASGWPSSLAGTTWSEALTAIPVAVLTMQ